MEIQETENIMSVLKMLQDLTRENVNIITANNEKISRLYAREEITEQEKQKLKALNSLNLELSKLNKEFIALHHSLFVFYKSHKEKLKSQILKINENKNSVSNSSTSKSIQNKNRATAVVDKVIPTEVKEAIEINNYKENKNLRRILIQQLVYVKN